MIKNYIILAAMALTLPAFKMLAKNGPNDCQAAPVLTCAIEKNFRITVKGFLKTDNKKARYIIQFFGNPSVRDAITEGTDFLGQTIIRAQSNQNETEFKVTLPPTQISDGFISATATLIEHGKPGDSSPYSASIPISQA